MTNGAEPDPAAINFGTDGWRAQLTEFTEPRVRLVGQAVAAYLAEEGHTGPVAIGYDAREHSRGFADALAAELTAAGRNVTLTERDCPTPALAWTVKTGAYAGGIAVTASHNPPSYNGIKFLPSDGAPALPPVTSAIEAKLGQVSVATPAERAEAAGDVTESDLTGPYVDHALDFADVDLDGLTVAYDAMYGSGRGVTDHVLAAAGAEVDRLHCERDAEFGGTPPEPTAANLGELIERVQSGPADLGIANDGDADRLAVVTPERGFLDPNHLLAALYADRVEQHAGDVVRTVSTSSLVDRVAAAEDQSVHETAVGFKWVAEAMADHDAIVGGEESGGFGLTAHLRNKDGVVLALVAAAAHARQPFDERVDDLTATHGEIHQDRVSVDCPDDRKAAVVDALEGKIPAEVADREVADVSTVDGFKLTLAGGEWLLVRPSGTEPKLRVYAEAGDPERTDALLEAGRALVEPLVSG